MYIITYKNFRYLSATTKEDVKAQIVNLLETGIPVDSIKVYEATEISFYVSPLRVGFEVNDAKH